MNIPNKSGFTVAMALTFIVAPILLCVLGDTPRRTWLKDFLSLLTILSFSLLIGQVYLSRVQNVLNRNPSLARIIRIHEGLGYFFVSVPLLHPVFIVLPRYFEAGVTPVDAFLKMITEVDNLGVVLGLVAYTFMLLIGFTAMFRDKLPINYRQWRVLHGLLSILFIAVATWHALDLGRHMNRLLSTYLIAVAAGAVLLLLRLYLFTTPRKALDHE